MFSIYIVSPLLGLLSIIENLKILHVIFCKRKFLYNRIHYIEFDKES